MGALREKMVAGTGSDFYFMTFFFYRWGLSMGSAITLRVSR